MPGSPGAGGWKHRVMWMNAATRWRLAANGVRAKYAAKLGAYFTSPHIIVLHENGVKARYAKELHAWLGDGDVTDICLLWREGVPLDYALAGLQSRLSAEDILRHFDEGISVEYMAVAHA